MKKCRSIHKQIYMQQYVCGTPNKHWVLTTSADITQSVSKTRLTTAALTITVFNAKINIGTNACFLKKKMTSSYLCPLSKNCFLKASQSCDSLIVWDLAESEECRLRKGGARAEGISLIFTVVIIIVTIMLCCLIWLGAKPGSVLWTEEAKVDTAFLHVLHMENKTR